MAFVVMAYILMAYVGMACIGDGGDSSHATADTGSARQGHERFNVPGSDHKERVLLQRLGCGQVHFDRGPLNAKCSHCEFGLGALGVGRQTTFQLLLPRNKVPPLRVQQHLVLAAGAHISFAMFRSRAL